ncbi:uncharacterized protein LY89DRAFT_574754 [Mollisia scopiformis]|uniref:Thioesterase-like superfamily-domain-containing protein n=1 Tax=Mollisia scopiformis TaxID=149040 RepID=A0A194XQ63_MOLSC|nr:uncharacterized protein LY89DRAFT_574754 [Mollisia scopiformis]KUJ22400.1 hypothetical protein LY89DRAFT_574754 [Mollisia scopiformis]
MASPEAGSTFAAATALKCLSSHEYEANFVDDWCIGSVPHGGYATATFMQVASKHFSSTLSAQNQPHTIAVHLDFLRRTSAGPALFTVKDTKLGRQASVIHVTLSQEGREEVIGSLTQGNISAEEGVSFDTTYSLDPAPLPVNLSHLAKDQDENWARAREMPFASFRKATQKTMFHFPRERQRKRSQADEWVRLVSGEKWTDASIGYLADMWQNPYDVKNMEKTAGEKGPAKFWYPTLLLNLDIKKSLSEKPCEWLFVRVNSKRIQNGRMDLEVVIMDEEGDIIALSHHIAFALPAARNLAARRTGASKI